MIFFALLNLIRAQTYVGQQVCSTLTTSATCAATDLTGLGWCQWNGSACVTLPCYMIDEVAACRSGGTFQTGGASTVCDSLEQFSLQYNNVCVDKGDGRLNYAFIRFTKSVDGSALSTSGTTSIAIASLTATSDNMFPLYTINPWKIPEASTGAAEVKLELEAILQKYLDFYQILIDTTNSHPFYLERTTYQALQLLRDQSDYTWANRKTTLLLIWQVAELTLFRIAKFSPTYYQTNYYFINFASVPYSRFSLKVNGQLHSMNIDWTAYSYTSNGYVQIYSYPPEQFGIRNALSDVIAIRPTISSTTAQTINLDTSFTNFYLEWAWTDSNLQIVQKDLKLYTFDESATPVIAQVSGITFTCDLTANSCKTNVISTPPITTATKRINYYITYGPGKCVDKNYVQCYLSIEQTAACTWNTATTSDYKCQ